jgi:hypothetical protein
MPMYMLSVHHSDRFPMPSEADREKAFQQVDRFNQQVQEAGAWVFAGGLHPPEIATVVNAMQGDPIITDGPFAETKEHLGGFWVIRAADLDEALDWAAKGSEACLGPVEVRPFQDDTEPLN